VSREEEGSATKIGGSASGWNSH